MLETDYHCHVLPGIDDGAKNTEISDKMLCRMEEQGIKNIVFTPHFYPHREKSVGEFLRRRENSFKKISETHTNLNFRLGAEIALERGFSEIPDIEKLAITDSRLILLELPFSGFGRWIFDELHDLLCGTDLKPIFAHVHRYTDILSKSEMTELLEQDAVFQFNAEAFRLFGGRRFASKLIKSGREIVFGSDAHDLDKRSPDYKPLAKHLKDEVMAASDAVLEKYKA